MSGEKKTSDFLVSLPDLAGKTYPAVAFKHIAEAAEALMENGWTLVVTDGFVLWRGENRVIVREAVSMVQKQDVLDKLFEIGGCGAAPNTYADGWDKAIEQAREEVEKMEGAMA